MIVFVNNKRVVLRRGMKIKHSLSMNQLRGVRSGEMVVTDQRGNLIGLEGSLADGSRLYVRKGESATGDTDSP